MSLYIGKISKMGMAKETVLGTPNTTPDIYLSYEPPENFFPAITTLEHSGVWGKADAVVKASQGPAEIKGAKFKIIVEPENIGQILMSCFGVDTVTGTATDGYQHAFTRLNNAQLPTYTFIPDKQLETPVIAGAMMNKFVLEAKAKEYVKGDVDFTALKQTGTTTPLTPTFSALNPFTFSQCIVTVGGSPSADYDDVKIEIDNMVKAEHTLTNDIYTTKIWSEGMRVAITADMYLQSLTEYNKFLAGTKTSFKIKMTSGEIIPGSSPSAYYSLEFDIQDLRYTAAPYPTPTGVYKISFSGVAVYDTSSLATITAKLLNSVSSAY